MQNSPTGCDSYVPPEVLQLGAAETLTLGQQGYLYLDGCNCSKENADDDELIGC